MKSRIILFILALIAIYGAWRHAPLEAGMGYFSGAVMAWAVISWRSSRIVELSTQVARAFLFDRTPLGEACQALSLAMVKGGFNVEPR